MSTARACLVVDDERDILDSVGRLFRKESFDVYLAESPEEGLALMRQHAIQVVLSDQRMPTTSGVEFLATLREEYPDAVRVLLTGYANIDHVVDAINEGHVYRYVSKPWDPEELRVIVRQCFERWETRDERTRLLAELEARNAELLMKNEELKTLDRLKSVFVEVVSHELNTPVAVILGYAHLLKREADGENTIVAKAIQGIDHGGQRLKNIAGRMFKLLEDETTPPLDLEVIRLPEFLESLQAEVSPFLQRRGQYLQIDVAPTAASFLADRGKLHDILVNLLMNAIKFSPDGFTILLRATTDDENVVLEVTDEGIGISEADRDQIFHPFFSTFESQYHSSGDFEFGKRGMGLGLSIARRFAEIHGGAIEARSAQGEGTTFIVTIPMRAPSAP